MAVADGVSHAPWIADATRELLALLDLEHNWNSYNAPRINPISLGYALAVIHETMDARTVRPVILPSPNGGVGFEWHERGVDLEIEVLASGELAVYFESKEKDQFEERAGNLDNLAAFVRKRIKSHLTAD